MGRMRSTAGGRRLLALLAVLAAAAAAGGVALATIPSSNGVIHACYQRSSGALRVIDAPRRKCTRSEKAISWNAAGRPRAGAAFAQFAAGAGGAGAIPVPETDTGNGVRVLTLALPADWMDVRQEVVLATVVFGNHAGQVAGRPLCAVLSDQGGFGAMDTLVPAPSAGGSAKASLSFESAGPPGGRTSAIELWCRVGTDHPPGALDVEVESATLTALPRVP